MTHPFERAGLGQAPFRVVRFEVRKYQACQGAPIQPGTSCDFCLTSISNVFWISGVDGNEFKVGCDCVLKTEDRNLSKEVKDLKRTHARELRAAKKMRATAERAEKRQREAVEDSERIEANYAVELHALDLLAKLPGFPGEFGASVAAQIREGRVLSARQRALIEKLWAEAQTPAPLVVNEYVASVGSKIACDVTVTVALVIEGIYGTQTLVIMRDDAGRILKWIATGRPKLQRGNRAHIRGTVKKHDTYQTQLQTVLTRCTIAQERIAS